VDIGDRGHDLADQTVQVGVRGALNVQVAAANVVDSLVVDHECAVRVLQGGVRGQDRVVGLDHGSGHLGGWVDGELQLGLLAVVHGEALHQQRGEARAGTSTEGVEDEEALQTGALIGQLADPVQDQIDDLLADGVVTTGVVVRRILLAGDQLLGVEQLTVGSGTDLVHHGGLQIHEHGTGHVLAGSGLAEEGVERVITSAHGLVGGHLAIGLDAVLQAVQLPAGVSNLDTSLADMDRDTFTLWAKGRRERDD